MDKKHYSKVLEVLSQKWNYSTEYFDDAINGAKSLYKYEDLDNIYCDGISTELKKYNDDGLDIHIVAVGCELLDRYGLNEKEYKKWIDKQDDIYKYLLKVLVGTATSDDFISGNKALKNENARKESQKSVSREYKAIKNYIRDYKFEWLVNSEEGEYTLFSEKYSFCKHFNVFAEIYGRKNGIENKTIEYFQKGFQEKCKDDYDIARSNIGNVVDDAISFYIVQWKRVINELLPETQVVKICNTFKETHSDDGKILSDAFSNVGHEISDTYYEEKSRLNREAKNAREGISIYGGGIGLKGALVGSLAADVATTAASGAIGIMHQINEARLNAQTNKQYKELYTGATAYNISASFLRDVMKSFYEISFRIVLKTNYTMPLDENGLMSLLTQAEYKLSMDELKEISTQLLIRFPFFQCVYLFVTKHYFNIYNMLLPIAEKAFNGKFDFKKYSNDLKDCSEILPFNQTDGYFNNKIIEYYVEMDDSERKKQLSLILTFKNIISQTNYMRFAVNKYSFNYMPRFRNNYKNIVTGKTQEKEDLIKYYRFKKYIYILYEHEDCIITSDGVFLGDSCFSLESFLIGLILPRSENPRVNTLEAWDRAYIYISNNGMKTSSIQSITGFKINNDELAVLFNTLSYSKGTVFSVNNYNLSLRYFSYFNNNRIEFVHDQDSDTLIQGDPDYIPRTKTYEERIRRKLIDCEVSVEEAVCEKLNINIFDFFNVKDLSELRRSIEGKLAEKKDEYDFQRKVCFRYLFTSVIKELPAYRNNYVGKYMSDATVYTEMTTGPYHDIDEFLLFYDDFCIVTDNYVYVTLPTNNFDGRNPEKRFYDIDICKLIEFVPLKDNNLLIKTTEGTDIIRCVLREEKRYLFFYILDNILEKWDSLDKTNHQPKSDVVDNVVDNWIDSIHHQRKAIEYAYMSKKINAQYNSSKVGAPIYCKANKRFGEIKLYKGILDDYGHCTLCDKDIEYGHLGVLATENVSDLKKTESILMDLCSNKTSDDIIVSFAPKDSLYGVRVLAEDIKDEREKKRKHKEALEDKSALIGSRLDTLENYASSISEEESCSSQYANVPSANDEVDESNENIQPILFEEQTTGQESPQEERSSIVSKEDSNASIQPQNQLDENTIRTYYAVRRRFFKEDIGKYWIYYGTINDFRNTFLASSEPSPLIVKKVDIENDVLNRVLSRIPNYIVRGDRVLLFIEDQKILLTDSSLYIGKDIISLKIIQEVLVFYEELNSMGHLVVRTMDGERDYEVKCDLNIINLAYSLSYSIFSFRQVKSPLLIDCGKDLYYCKKCGNIIVKKMGAKLKCEKCGTNDVNDLLLSKAKQRNERIGFHSSRFNREIKKVKKSNNMSDLEWQNMIESAKYYLVQNPFVVCPHCNNKMPLEAAFCSECGTKL